MNNSQKRYTVEQISKYKLEAKEFADKADKNRWFVYGAIALFIACEQIRGNVDLNYIEGLIMGITQYTGLAFGVENLKNMIGNMSRKSGLENLAENLDYQLHCDNLEEKEENSNKGRGL